MMQMRCILGTNVKRETFWEMPSNVWGEGHLQKGWGERMLSPVMAQNQEGPCRGLYGHVGSLITMDLRNMCKPWAMLATAGAQENSRCRRILTGKRDEGLTPSLEMQRVEPGKSKNTEHLVDSNQKIFMKSTPHVVSKDPTSHPRLPLHHKLWALEKMSFFFS